MRVVETGINGLVEIVPSVYSDERGYFMETFRKDIFDGIASGYTFVQDNESKSQKDVLRGLHFQASPHEQGKLVRVISGSVLDVAVDIRTSSPTYGKYHSVVLSAENKKQFWVPPGFAHGFLVLEDDTVFSYKCTGYYNKEAEGSIRWDDPEIGIDWGISLPLLSEKDKIAPLFSEFVSPFHK